MSFKILKCEIEDNIWSLSQDGVIIFHIFIKDDELIAYPTTYHYDKEQLNQIIYAMENIKREVSI